MSAQKEFSKSAREINAQSLLDILVKETAPSCLIVSHRTLPWNVTQGLIEHKKVGPDDRTRSFINNVEIVYESHRLKAGEAILVKKGSVVWHVEKKVTKPRIQLISEDSSEGKSLLKKNPDLNLGLKVLVEARELGHITFKRGALPKIFKVRL